MCSEIIDAAMGSTPSPNQPETRAVAITTLDGRMLIDGSSNDLGNATDFELLNALRQWADVILVGATTVKKENYFGVRTDQTLSEVRIARGQQPVPPIAALSTRLDVPTSSQFFTKTFTPPLFLVPENTIGMLDQRRIDVETAGAEVVDYGARPVDKLRDLGFQRILVEGGISVYNDMLVHDEIDIFHLTIAPRILGGASEHHVHFEKNWQIRGMVNDDEGFVFLRLER